MRSACGLAVVAAACLVVPVGNARAQSQYGEGLCPGPPADGGVAAVVMAKPDDKPKRLGSAEDLTAGNGAYRLANADDEFHNLSGRMRRVDVTAVIDTTGRVVPGTVTIKKSSSGRLSQALCDAVPEMKFRPGKKSGTPVFTQYAETFKFVSSSASSTERGPEDQGSTR